MTFNVADVISILSLTFTILVAGYGYVTREMHRLQDENKSLRDENISLMKRISRLENGTKEK